MVGMGSNEPDRVLDWEELCGRRRAAAAAAAAAAAFFASLLGKVLPAPTIGSKSGRKIWEIYE
jgi:hypothetical protein